MRYLSCAKLAIISAYLYHLLLQTESKTRSASDASDIDNYKIESASASSTSDAAIAFFNESDVDGKMVCHSADIQTVHPPRAQFVRDGRGLSFGSQIIHQINQLLLYWQFVQSKTVRAFNRTFSSCTIRQCCHPNQPNLHVPTNLTAN